MTQLKKIGALIDDYLAQGITSLNEDKAKQIFRMLDMPVVEEVQANDVSQVKAAGETLGYPLVLKGVAGGILHKSEAGLVVAGINGPEQLEDAAAGMAREAGKDLETFLVQPMVQGKREFVAGMFRDEQFGPVIMFGLGGVLTEALSDIIFRIAPLCDADLNDMLDGLGAQKLLGDFRGEAAVDRQQLKSVIKGVSDLACACPGIKEIDINPLIIRSDGISVAVDGLMVLADAHDENESVRPMIDFKALAACFYPESIAFVGASSTPGKWGHMLPVNTFARDYKGKVFLVNPRGGKIMGRRVYKDLDEIEGNVDLAVVTVPAHRVMGIFQGPALWSHFPEPAGN